MQLFSIQYLSGLAGSGKSEVAINQVIKKAKNYQKECYSVPSIILANEIFIRTCAKAIGIKVTIIHSENCDNVTKTLLHHLKNCNPDEGEILIITHAALQNIPFWPNSKNWSFVIDEVFNVTQHFEINLKEHQDHIKDFCKIDFSEKYTFIEVYNVEELKRRIKNKTNDKIFTDLKPVYQSLLNSTLGKCYCFSHQTYNDNFFNGDGQKFVIDTLYSPKFLEGFKEVLLIGAGFEESLNYHVWSKIYGVNFTQSELTGRLREVNHTAKIVFHYITDRRWSMNLLGKTFDDQSVLDYFYSLVMKKLDDERFLILKNKKDKFSTSNMTECPYSNQGLNKFDNHTNFVFSGAFNNYPSYYAFMDHFSLAKEAENFLMSEKFYQSILRTAFRKMDFDGTIHVFTPSFATIEPILNRFSNYELDCMDDDSKMKDMIGLGKNGRPVDKNSINSNEQLKALRSLSYRMLKKTKLIDDDSQSIRWTLFDKPQLTDDGNYSWPIQGSNLPLTADKFFTAMKNEAKETLVSNKMDQFLVSLAKFSKGRKREDIELVFGQFLDFDSELYPFTCEMFQSLFPDVKCLSFPTFSGGNRRRLAFLFDKPLAADDAQKIYDEVFDKITKKYPDCKLDPKSKELQQIYFMPCKSDQIAEYKDGNLFDTDKCLALSCQWPLSEEQIKQHKKQEIVREEKVYDNDYSKIITPFIQQMRKGNYYDLGCEAVGHCKTKFPSLKDRLFDDFRMAGMNKINLTKCQKLWLK